MPNTYTNEELTQVAIDTIYDRHKRGLIKIKDDTLDEQALQHIRESTEIAVNNILNQIRTGADE